MTDSMQVDTKAARKTDVKKRKRDAFTGPDGRDDLLDESGRDQRTAIVVAQAPVGWSGVPVTNPEKGGSVDVLVRTETDEKWRDDEKLNVADECVWTTGTVAAIRKSSEPQSLLIHVTGRGAE
jgi:hypothetical protein